MKMYVLSTHCFGTRLSETIYKFMKHLHTQACVIQSSQCYSFSDMLAAEGAILQQCVDVSSISDL